MPRVITINDETGPHPDFDTTQPESDDNPRDRLIPAGTLIDHPKADMLVTYGKAYPEGLIPSTFPTPQDAEEFDAIAEFHDQIGDSQNAATARKIAEGIRSRERLLAKDLDA